MTELEPYQALAKQDIFKAFEMQLRKDFESAACALPDDFVLEKTYDLLLKQITRQVKQLSTGNYLQSLLYRIDVSEAQIKKQTQSNANSDFEEIVAELIIKRILQKVILKIHFSRK